jgi:hypothetical protein
LPVPELPVTPLPASQRGSKRKLKDISDPNIESPIKMTKIDYWTGVHKVVKSIPSFPIQRIQKYFNVQTIPNEFPRPLLRNSTGTYTIWFSQFWSSSPPPTDVGFPGDMFFVVSFPTHSVFIKKDVWIPWDGITRLPFESQLAHPGFPNMVVWFTESKITWAPWKNPSKHAMTTLLARHPPIITADDCVRTILQSIPLNHNQILGSRTSQIGGSLLYWKTEFERAELHAERRNIENAELKAQIAEMQRTHADRPLAIAQLDSPTDVVAKMRDALSRNPGLRGPILQCMWFDLDFVVFF